MKINLDFFIKKEVDFILNGFDAFSKFCKELREASKILRKKVAEGILLRASKKGLEETVDSLIKRGINLNVRNNMDQTPLMLAMNNNLKVAKFLIEAGADMNAKDKRGNTPLMFAVMLGKKEAVELLISSGADIQIANNEGMTPLKMATGLKREKIKNLILQEQEKKISSQTPVVVEKISAFEAGAEQPKRIIDSQKDSQKGQQR